MKYKCKYFTMKDRCIEIYVKKPFFRKFSEMSNYFDNIFKDNNEKYLGCGISEDREIVLTFVLRDYKDIKPYIDMANRMGM